MPKSSRSDAPLLVTLDSHTVTQHFPEPAVIVAASGQAEDIGIASVQGASEIWWQRRLAAGF